jgi:hypothetical protein
MLVRAQGAAWARVGTRLRGMLSWDGRGLWWAPEDGGGGGEGEGC